MPYLTRGTALFLENCYVAPFDHHHTSECSFISSTSRSLCKAAFAKSLSCFVKKLTTISGTCLYRSINGSIVSSSELIPLQQVHNSYSFVDGLRCSPSKWSYIPFVRIIHVLFINLSFPRLPANDYRKLKSSYAPVALYFQFYILRVQDGFLPFSQ